MTSEILNLDKRNIEFETPSINMEEIEKFTIPALKLINRYRPSAELPMIYVLNGQLSALVNGYGRGIQLIGEKAMGKGEILKGTFNPTENLINFKVTAFDVDTFTISFFHRFVKETQKDLANYLIIMEDLSTTVDGDYLDTCYNTVAKLIWDKKAGKGTAAMYSKELGIDIKNANDITIEVNSFVALFGMTNEIYRRVKKFTAYNTMWKDRLTEFYLFITYMQKEARRKLRREFAFNRDSTNRMRIEDLRLLILSLIPKNFKPKTLLPFANNITPEYFDEYYKRLYRYQHTEERGQIYLHGDLSINAYLNGRDEITKTDLGLYYLYRPNLLLYDFSPSIQRIAQNVGYCRDIEELSHVLQIPESNIKMTISQSQNAKEILNYEGDIVSHTDAFAKLLINQEKFIQGCVDY